MPLNVRLQILTTEHWSLLSARSLSWNEASSRAATFPSALSAAVEALAVGLGSSGVRDSRNEAPGTS